MGLRLHESELPNQREYDESTIGNLPTKPSGGRKWNWYVSPSLTCSCLLIGVHQINGGYFYFTFAVHPTVRVCVYSFAKLIGISVTKVRNACQYVMQSLPDSMWPETPPENKVRICIGITALTLRLLVLLNARKLLVF